MRKRREVKALNNQINDKYHINTAWKILLNLKYPTPQFINALNVISDGI